MNAQDQWKQNTSDPLGLRNLEAVEPGYDGWAQIESALQAHQNSRRNWQRAGGWLAIAASLVLVVSVILRTSEDNPASGEPTAVLAQENITTLIGLSQSIEAQVKKLRQETNSMPAKSAIYVAELEDLIAQVDNELSLKPDSIDLWGQRVNLMLDLARIYQQQWQIDYGRMAAL